MITLLVALTGGAGAAVRFLVDGAIRARRPARFPWPTVLINVTGSLFLGVLTGLVLFRGVDTDLRLIAGTGFCGGYTTFSTASIESVRLVQQGRSVGAIVNALGSVLLTIGAAALGLLLTR